MIRIAWLLLCASASLFTGCGDDLVKVADCMNGRSAWHGGTSLVCYESNSTPYASRAWAATDSATNVCEFCDGFAQ